jgi:shikimate kinase
MEKHIILIGFMGSGKSTVGKELAKQLNLSFVDSDEVIEKQQGKSISQIFDESGEEAFRKMEQDFIATLPNLEPGVISVGGGMPCFEDNMDRLKANGKVFYLNTSLMTLTQRLMNDRENRPLLTDLSQNELSTYVFELLTNRTAFYRKAHVIIPNEGNDYLKAVSEILKEANL